MRKIDLASKVRRGLHAERQSAEMRLDENAVAETAREDAAPVVGSTNDTGRPASSASRFKVAISQLVSNPFNPRTFYNAETIDSLSKSFDVQGQIESIKITKLPQFPDKLVIVDGERRVRAAKSRGDEFIDAEWCEENLEFKALYLLAYRANKERDQQTIFDDAVAWKKLIEEKVYKDYTELSIAIGEESSHVNKVMLLADLPQVFFNKMAQAPVPIGKSHAYNLKLIHDRAGLAVAEHWLQQVIEGRASVRTLEQVAAPQSRASARRPHYQSRVKFASAAGVDLGEMKLFADGRTELSLKGIHGEAQRTLADRVQVLIEDWSREFTDQSTSESETA
ncbi:ParB/RepB/Spo0J family partition protein [Paraburkholderia sp. SIMBA_054]|uniref:ParB/RepB/Spo0J family partition protein n=1 Tax=Paraburkholderia sp. SIMBA_054 TaxID=3085795 RepID=UPI00397A7BF7